MIVIKAVDGSDETIKALLRYLQLKVLPGDEPQATNTGCWWLAYDQGLPVGFAGVIQSVNWFDTGYLSRSGVLYSHRGVVSRRNLYEPAKPMLAVLVGCG